MRGRRRGGCEEEEEEDELRKEDGEERMLLRVVTGTGIHWVPHTLPGFHVRH